jgi:hypothetical protein
LTQASVLSIVKRAINKGALPKNANGIYFVLSSSDCTETGFCTQACGWHTYSGNIKYSWVGNPQNLCPNSCSDQSVSPNGNLGADAMISVIAHEAAEAVTDPDLNAWYDSNGEEIADKCAWIFGTTHKLSNGASYNMIVNGYKYLIQELWNQRTQSCTLS